MNTYPYGLVGYPHHRHCFAAALRVAAGADHLCPPILTQVETKQKQQLTMNPIKRTPYQQPVTEVVILQHRGHLMIVSEPGQASIQDYNWQTVTEE